MDAVIFAFAFASAVWVVCHFVAPSAPERAATLGLAVFSGLLAVVFAVKDAADSVTAAVRGGATQQPHTPAAPGGGR